MELWLCKRNQYGMLKDDEKVSFFHVNNPHEPHETIEYARVNCKSTARTFIDKYIEKYGMLKAHVSNQPLPRTKNDCVWVEDFGVPRTVRLLSMVSGHKLLTFLAKVNEENCYVQFFVRHHKGRSTVHCRARENVYVFATDDREAGNYLGFLIFEH